MTTSTNVCEKTPGITETSSVSSGKAEGPLDASGNVEDAVDACGEFANSMSSDKSEAPASENVEGETHASENGGRDNKSLGQRGEDAAAAFLQRQGYEIIERNWRCAYGEADIVAMEDEEVVFVEVKTRQGISHGMPEDAVTTEKRDRYEKIAASYLSEHPLTDCYVRFDVIAILVTDNKHGLLRHHRNAFVHEG